MKTAWDLSLLYSSLKDPRIEQDMKKAERATAQFAKKWKGTKKYLSSPLVLKEAIDEYQELINISSGAPYLYAMYRKILNTHDKEAEAVTAQLDERLSKLSVCIEFFGLSIGKIPKEKQSTFLKHKALAPYAYFLSQIFEHSSHDLTEAEERILTLTSDIRYGRWVQATDNILNAHTVSWKGKKIPLAEAQEKVSMLPMEERRALHIKINEVYKAVAPVAEGEVNAVITNKKIGDELRGYKTSYEATVKGHGNTMKSIESLVKAVEETYPVVHKFYKHKAKLLKEKVLMYADRSAPIGIVKHEYSFEQSVEIVRKAFFNLKPEYADIFDRLLNKGQVDVFPKTGKEGGAFCSSNTGTPTFVLLNHVGKVRSLMTLAHEMGHAIHAERSKTQPAIYQGHSTAVAETASTFFEQVVFDALFETLSEEERLVAFHDHVQDSIATIFRQVAAFKMEVELHDEIKKKGYIPKEQMAAIHNKHMSSYLGKSVMLQEDDGYAFVSWSHIRRFFYVYTYAYGLLVSRALYARVKKNPQAIEEVDAFLSAGGSMSPKDIFKKVGLNVESPTFWKMGLASMEADIEQFCSMGITKPKKAKSVR